MRLNLMIYQMSLMVISSHISDIHAGSLSNEEKTKYAVDLINKQKSNLILSLVILLIPSLMNY